MTALELFRSGMDTMEIAKSLGIHQWEAERRLTVEMSNHKGLPSPYGARP